MNLSKIVKKVTGKQIHSEVTLGYVVGRGLPFLIGLLKGMLISPFLKKAGRKLFIGKQVTLRMKKKIRLGNNVRLEPFVSIDALSKDGVKLGDNVKLGDYSKIICSGSLSNLGKGLEIGKNSFFSEYTFFGSAGGIKIGENVIAGQGVRFHAENHNYSEPDLLIREQGVSHKGIEVGDNCWLGAGAVFLDGAKVGLGCVVAANALVTKEFPDNVIIGGVPAKIIKNRF
ncbi:acyltransferase [Streptococcus oriscaviae]|uniref:Acyltransferase n=1 Tax=Streptococcus oriscaviae TaxID=2781599 RepID=A0ABX7YM29_9STRE|nr:acyltransferase [Streptococcus oriscaviae]QUE54319.1 acyltransferase [Streptococcus oriscaviae]